MNKARRKPMATNLASAAPRVASPSTPCHLHCLCLPAQQDPQHDTDVFNADGMAPLHLAARGGHMGAVAFLLQKGSFVDMQDWDVSGGGVGVLLRSALLAWTGLVGASTFAPSISLPLRPGRLQPAA